MRRSVCAADLVEVPPGGIEIEIEMEIDVQVERLGEVEDACEMGVRVGVRVGAAADHLPTIAQRLDQKLLAAGIVGEAFLRKDTERQVDRPGIVTLQRLHRLEAAQSDAGIDLDVGSHARGAVDDSTFEYPGAARVDVLDRETLLHLGDGADRFGDAAVIMPAAAEQAGLVEMDVAVDEAGQGEASADIDFGGLASERRFDGGDPAARDADVHRVGGTTQQGVAKDKVKGGLGGHGSCGRNLVHSAAFGGSRLSAV
ncbi:hypothetical protein ACVIQY_000555 [Bradyrhizobium sp. USDA 3051]